MPFRGSLIAAALVRVLVISWCKGAFIWYYLCFMHLVFQGFSWLHLSLADFCSLAGRKPFKARELSLLCWRNFSQLLSLWSHSICQLPPLVCAAQNKQHAKIITQPIRILCLVSQPMPKEHTLAWKHLDLDQASGREVNFVQWLGDADTRKWCKLMGLKRVGSRDILTSTCEFVSGHNQKAFWAKNRPFLLSSLQAFPGLGSAAAHPAPHLGPPMRHISCRIWVAGRQGAKRLSLLGTGCKSTQGQTMCVRSSPVHPGVLWLSAAMALSSGEQDAERGSILGLWQNF